MILNDYPESSYGAIITGKKNKVLAVILNCYIAGIGTIYAGYHANGFVTLICHVILGATTVILSMFVPFAHLVAIYIIYAVAALCIIGYSIKQTLWIVDENNYLWAEYLENKEFLRL